MCRVHLVRHAEVHNPTGVLYGRLPRYRLTERGRRMAESVAEYFQKLAKTTRFSAVYASPLLRAQQSARPIADALMLPLRTEERLIEPTSRFEGQIVGGAGSILKHPRAWPLLVNPFTPSWGEAYKSVALRVYSALTEALDNHPGSDIIMVSHQSPIWLLHRRLAGQPLRHNPKLRRCALSSVTVFRWNQGVLTEIDYQQPAQAVVEGQLVDRGAV